eukprot:gene8929-biopygen22674
MLLLEATEVASCYDERACALANSCAHVHAATSVLARWRIRASMFMLRRACLRAGAFVRPCSCYDERACALAHSCVCTPMCTIDGTHWERNTYFYLTGALTQARVESENAVFR